MCTANILALAAIQRFIHSAKSLRVTADRIRNNSYSTTTNEPVTEVDIMTLGTLVIVVIVVTGYHLTFKKRKLY